MTSHPVSHLRPLTVARVGSKWTTAIDTAVVALCNSVRIITLMYTHELFVRSQT